MTPKTLIGFGSEPLYDDPKVQRIIDDFIKRHYILDWIALNIQYLSANRSYLQLVKQV